MNMGPNMEELIKLLCNVHKFPKEFPFGLSLVIERVGFINE